MTSSPEPAASQHFEEFRLRVDAARGKGVEGVWDVFLDLGMQASLLRHNQVTMLQADEGLDWRLFGYPANDGSNRRVGGAFPSLTSAVKEIKDTLASDSARARQAVADRKSLFSSWWAKAGTIAVILGEAWNIYRGASGK